MRRLPVWGRQPLENVLGFPKFFVGELKGRPRTVYIEVTLRCNAKCDFCSYWQDGRRPELKDFSPIVRKLNPIAVVLTGGEPTVRRDLPDIIGKIKDSGAYFISMVTNGSMLTVPKAKLLRQKGLSGLSISLNYLDEAHDRERHIAGLYNKLQDLIPRLAKLQVFPRLSLNTVLMNTNLDKVVAIAEQAKRWGVSISVSCYSVNKTGHDGYVIGPDRFNELREVVEELRRRKREGWPIGNSDWYLARIAGFHERGGAPGCTAGVRTLHVTPSGYIKRCPDLPVVAHYTAFDSELLGPNTCDRCWYACRGEAEAPVDAARIRYWGGMWLRKDHGAPATGDNDD